MPGLAGVAGVEARDEGRLIESTHCTGIILEEAHILLAVVLVYRGIFFVLYATLFHLPPLRFHCVGGCWDRTQDSCDFGIGSQTL
jgi:hypothetical protein